VDIRQQRRTRTIQKCILTCSSGTHPVKEKTCARLAFNPETQAASATLERNPNGRVLSFAAAVFGVVVSVSPQAAHAQEYPWCLSREGYLYCFYKTNVVVMPGDHSEVSL
jgi:hypothetical protein